MAHGSSAAFASRWCCHASYCAFPGLAFASAYMRSGENMRSSFSGEMFSMETFLLVNSVLVWIVVLANLVLTLALVRRVNAFPGSLAGVGSGLPIGTPAPDFSLQTLTGQTVTLANFTSRST